MNKINLFRIFFIIFIFNFTPIISQININDSTVQVIGYWNLGDKQTYLVSQEKYKIKGSDTTSRELTTYYVDIVISDSTKESYIVDWFYHDFKVQSTNEVIKKLSTLLEEFTIKIKTDEFGVLFEVLNWEEVQKYIYKLTAKLKEEFKDVPNMNNIISQIENIYSTKESITNGTINEIHQFYSFHGGKYKLHEEIKSEMKIPNLLGGEPFDTEVFVSLDEINEEDNNSIIRMQQIVNSDQLTEATFKYLKNLAISTNLPEPKIEEFSKLVNNTWVSSRMHGSGWPIFSIETKETSTQDIINVEETIIEIQ